MSTQTSSIEKQRTIMSKDELIHQVAARAGMNLKDTNTVIDAFTDVVGNNVALGHEVRLMGFGIWSMRKVAARQVKAVRDGTPMLLPAHKRVRFSVGAVLAQAAHGPDLAPETAANRNTLSRRA